MLKHPVHSLAPLTLHGHINGNSTGFNPVISCKFPVNVPIKVRLANVRGGGGADGHFTPVYLLLRCEHLFQ